MEKAFQMKLLINVSNNNAAFVPGSNSNAQYKEFLEIQ